MHRTSLAALVLVLWVPGVPLAGPLGTPAAIPGRVIQENGEITLNGGPLTVVRYTWSDSLGRTRSVALVPGSGATSGYAARMTYQVDDGGLRTVDIDAGPGGDGGFGYFVSHEAYRTFTDGRPSNTLASLHGEDDSPFGRGLPSTGTASNTAPTSGTMARTVHEYRLSYPRWGTIASMPDPTQPTSPVLADHQKFALPVVIRWAFTGGEDYPLWSVEYDLSAASDRIATDVRAPYGVMRFNEGIGNAVTALRWGDRYRFAADAGGGDFGTVAKPAAALPWTWNQANTGRRYNVLGSGSYEFGIVDTRAASDSPYGDGYANFRGLTSASGGCDYGMRSVPCDWEWPFQSFQYDYAPDYNPTTRPKLGWGSAAFLGSSLGTVYTPQPVPFSGKGRITYGVHVVFGRSGAGTPLALSQAAAPVGGPHTLELRVAPKAGGVASYQVFGDPATYTDRNRALRAWSSVKASAAPAGAYQLLGFDHDCGTLGGCSDLASRACAGSAPECRFAMNAPIRTVAVLALPGTTLYPRPLYLDFPAQASGTTSAPMKLSLWSFSAGAGKTVAVQSSSTEFLVTQDSSIRPCSSGHDAGNLQCGVQVRFAPAPGPARTVTATLTITSNQSAAVTVDLEATALASAPSGLLVAPASLDFGGQSMGTTSPAQAITITNSSASTVTVSAISAANPAYVTSSGCGVLAAGASCTAAITFTPPGSSGTPLNGTVNHPATLTIASNAPGNPHSVSLAGAAEKSLVTHYYRSILRRAPDTGGVPYWQGEAARVAGLGANVNETWFALAQGFYTSTEYLAFNRNDTGFVTDLYATFFNRAPDGSGLGYWTSQLTQGMPREVVLVGFMFSTEFANFTQGIFGSTAARAEVDTVVDFYRGLLSRLPDSGGFNYWVGQFRTAQCSGGQAVYAQVEGISNAYVNSPEYGNRGRNNAQFVGDMYNAFMRRGGDLGGVQYWVSQLDSGARTRENVRQAFISTPEFNQRVVAVINQGCL